MRGAAALMTVLGAAVLIGERVRALGMAAVATVSLGVFLMRRAGYRIRTARRSHGAGRGRIRLRLHSGRRHGCAGEWLGTGLRPLDVRSQCYHNAVDRVPLRGW